MTTQITASPYTKEEFKAAAQALAATFKGTANEAEVKSILSDYYALACEDQRWLSGWSGVMFEIEAL